MATMNPFDLLDDDAEDPSLLIAAKAAEAAAAEQKKSAPGQGQQKKPAQLPTKPPPPSQAVREAKTGSGRGGSRGGQGYGPGRGGRGFNRGPLGDNSFESSGFPAGDGENGKPSDRPSEMRGSRGPFRGGRRGGFSNGEGGEGERQRRPFERRSGTGRGYEMKREGAGRGNWGTPSDEIPEVTEEAVNEKENNLAVEKPAVEEEANKDNAKEAEEKEPEDKEMTLEEYEKVLEEKRKALQALKTEERKVDPKEFESMQVLSNKKENNDVFIKLGSQKDKKKEAYEKDEKAKKSVSITEFLKPAEGEGYYRPGGRGRGRGRGGRGYSGNNASNMEAPRIEDPGHFPTLGGK